MSDFVLGTLRLLAAVLIITLLALFSSCEKQEPLTDDEQGQLECGPHITWVYQNELEYTQLIVEILPIYEGQGNPNTTFWWSEKGTYLTNSYDGGGQYHECYFSRMYVAYALIDPGLAGTLGIFVEYERGVVLEVNILDGISWN